MVCCKNYASAGIVGLLLFTPGLCPSSIPRSAAGIQQLRKARNATVLVRAEPPARDPAQRFQLKGLDADVKAIAFAAHSNRVLTLDCDGKLRFWDLKSGAQERKFAVAVISHGVYSIGDNNYYSALAVSPDGRFAAVCGLEASRSSIEVYDIREMKKVKEIEPIPEFFGGLALSFSTRGDRLAVALHSCGALQWSIGDAKALTLKKSPALPLNPKNYNWAISVTHLRGDDVIAVGLLRRTIAFYDAQSGAELESFPLPVQEPKLSVFKPYQLVLSPDGGVLLVVARGSTAFSESVKPDNMITLWDMTTGEHAWMFTHEKFHVGQAAFSPDGRYVAVGFVNNPDVRLYRLSDNKEVAIFRGHTKGVACIAFSPDGTMIASGSLDKTAIVWNVKDGLLATAERPKTEKDYANCWDTLRDGKPLEATEAVASLAVAKDDAVDWLDNKLSPVRKPDAVKVQKWLAQLDDNEPEKRDEASRELAALGVLVEGDIKKVLAGAPSAEVKRRLKELQEETRLLWVHDRDRVRAVRSVYVLERIGSERAVALLKKLADGAPAARLTREAKISLERLEVRAKARQ